jgi:hypothetical protein
VAHVAWYDRRLRGSDPAGTDVFAAEFTPLTGVGANIRLTDVTFSMNVPSLGTPNFGDYNGAAAGLNRFVYVWADGRDGNPNVYFGARTQRAISADPPSIEVCGAGSASTAVTVVSGPGLFQADVTLGIAAVTPAEPSISALFDPNPVTPSPEGAVSAMTVWTQAATPLGVYTLTVLGDDGFPPQPQM